MHTESPFMGSCYRLFSRQTWFKRRHFSDANGDWADLGEPYSSVIDSCESLIHYGRLIW